MNPKYYVYTLLSIKDHIFYTGLTTDLKLRLNDHSRGIVSGCFVRIPFKLIHYEYFVNYEDAKRRENYLKTNLGKAQLKQTLRRSLLERFKY